MITDLFSKRQRRARGDVPDVYQHEIFPQKLRAQVVLLWRDAFQLKSHYPDPHRCMEQTVDILRKEYGKFALCGEGYLTPTLELSQFFMQADIEEALDCVELTFRFIDSQLTTDFHYQDNFANADFIGTLNGRMKEAGFGYRFENRMIIRADSDYVHEEMVKPALAILRENDFAGANAEFRSAHEHYRHNRYKECLNECLKCFESTMKIVCDRQGWAYSSKATAATLIDVLLDNELLPTFTQSQLTSVRQLLSSGIPTVRNRLGGHGQGSSIIDVPEHLATYVLNLTATTVRLLSDADQALQGN